MINVGDSFLHYRVLSRIGTGGMGEVFLARDTNLGRKVAIKILRKKFGQDKEGLRRFVQEAKAASALNHPNIITIYEVGEYDESNYISSEYIEGKTLHARLGKEPLLLNEVLRISTQIVEAIAAAHAAGIVHRDIKPENVMIRRDGYVKVLDFGLAKLTEKTNYSGEFDNESETMVETNPGMILGTVAYMSPEQARGREIDSRSDIWSVGVLLYEMITGVRPFTGETTSDVLAAILRSHPPDMSPFGVPAELEHIVRKALRKDREERYQNIRDLLIDLKDLARDLELVTRSGETPLRASGQRGPAASTAELTKDPVSTAGLAGPATHSISEMLMSQFRLHPKSMTAGAAGLILLLAAGAVGFKLWYQRPAVAGAFGQMKLSKLATFARTESTMVAVSPDGKYVAYIEGSGDRQSIWVRHVATGSNVAIVPETDMQVGSLSYSRDGDFVYFGQRPKGGTYSIFRVATLGGPVKRVVADTQGPLAFSPDGSQMAFPRGVADIFIANADGTSERVLAKAPDGMGWSSLSWSPDPDELVAAAYLQSGSQARLFRISVNDGSVSQLPGPDWFSIAAIAFDPNGGGIFVSGRDLDSQRLQIWHVSYPDGEVNRVTNDLASYEGISVSADGRSVVSVQIGYSANIYVHDAGKGQDKKVTSDMGRDNGLSGLGWVPDGRIVYTARTIGNQDIWIVDSDGSNKHQLTSERGKNFHPTVSPDGTRITFVSSRSGNIELWTMNLDGTDPLQLTQSEGIEGRPQYTPDGKWIIYDVTSADDKSTMWKIPANGGQAVQMASKISWRPAISPDGKWVASRFKDNVDDRAYKLVKLPTDGTSTAEAVTAPAVSASSLFRWSSDGRSLLFMDQVVPGSGTTISSFDVATQRQNSLVAKTDEGGVYYFDVSRNGKGIAYSRGVKVSEAVLISNFR